MNWGRAKTILLVLFLLTDLFLLVVLLQARLTAQKISEQTVSEVVSILQNAQIEIEPEQIPVKRIPNQNIIMRNFFQNPDEAALTMLGDRAQAISVFPERYEYQFSSQSGTLYVKKDGFFYESTKETVPFHAEALPTDSNVKTHVLNALSHLGIQKGTAEVYHLAQVNGLYLCDVRPVYRQQPIYGVSMRVTVDSEAVVNISGHWFVVEEIEENSREGLLDVTTVLTDLIFEEGRVPVKIESVGHGFYMADEFLSSREIVAVPVYVITEVSGNKRIFDARVGTAVE